MRCGVLGGQRLVQITSFAAVAMMLNIQPAFSQTDVDEIHIQPRGHTSAADTLTSLTKGSRAIVRKSVQLVLVPVTVTDQYNRIVPGLAQNDFQVYENKLPQPIKHFWTEGTPVSLGIVLDVSGSMSTKINRARDAITALLSSSNPQDEFFLATFADRPALLHDFTSDPEDIKTPLLLTTPKGRTSLLDAIVLALSTMNNARYQRKALIIISDGGDNRSRYTENEVKSRIKEADVLLYSIGIYDSEFQTPEEKLGPELLTDMSSVTGASSYTLDNPDDLPVAAEQISHELRNQYILGYSPDTTRHDGKWRKIKVKLAVPRNLPALKVKSKTGYYAPE
jgi:Ca-activated chloride channel family protein